jgi:UMF1 family MFS transporter
VEPAPSWILPALLLVAVATLTSEFANLFYNAMLPTLADPNSIGRWSGWAWSLGYLSGLCCLVLAMLALIGPQPRLSLGGPEALDVRAVFPLVAACWYLVFSLPLLLFTPDEPPRQRSLRQAVLGGVRQLRTTVRQARRHGPILRFLIVHLIYTDGLAGLFAFGGVYAAGTFDMTEREVLGFGIALNVTAGIGAFALAWLADRRSSKTTIMVSLAGLIGCGAAVVWVQQAALFWVFGMLLGVFVGPVQAASRSYLGRLAPPDLRNQMFGLYALSGKATAFLAPLLVGWVSYAANSQRAGISVLLLYFILGLLLMWRVPTDQPASPARSG